jgi:hypothetical protein
MARATECLITVKNALQLKELLKENSIPKLFICKGCKQPVRPHAEGDANSAHFEHLKRNLECPYSEKSKAKNLYAKYKADKAKSRLTKQS